MALFSRMNSSILALCLAVTPATVQANDLLGGIVGGMIGGAIINEANKNKRKTRTVVVDSSQRQQNREAQRALNYFGFPAGTPDGIMGSRSRTAVSSYQAYLDFPVTGRLDPMQMNILVGAHNRALSGAPDVIRLISTSPQGPRAALTAQRDLMFGGTTASRSVGYPGLPLEVSHAVDEIAESSDPTAEQLMQRAGFIQLADLNGDGNNDYILDTSYSGSTFWCRVDRQCKALVFVSTPNGYSRNDLLVVNPVPATFTCVGASCTLAPAQTQVASAEVPVAPAAPAQPESGGTVLAQLPSFGANTAVQKSLTDHCNTVTLVSATRGGFVTQIGGGAPAVVLSEQFCLARGAAVLQSNELVASFGGLSPDQVAQQCAGFGPAMKTQVNALSLKAADDVLNETAAFVVGTGMAPDQLKTTARVCLGSAYQSENLDIAIGSALLMVALGEQAYSELLGHHLSQGYGATERKDLSLEWYSRAFNALQNGAVPVFAAEQTNRAQLLLWAVKGGAETASTPIAPATSPQQASLPVFGAQSD